MEIENLFRMTFKFYSKAYCIRPPVQRRREDRIRKLFFFFRIRKLLPLIFFLPYDLFKRMVTLATRKCP